MAAYVEKSVKIFKTAARTNILTQQGCQIQGHYIKIYFYKPAMNTQQRDFSKNITYNNIKIETAWR